MTAIVKIKQYLNRMSKSLEDKLFFLPHVKDATVFLDYGCADGELLEAIHKEYPEALLYGYDQSLPMINIARQRHIPNAQFTKDVYSVLEDICFLADNRGHKTCLILSSVLHEICSSHSTMEVDKFWNQLFGMNFDYICIRDMGMSVDEFWTPMSEENVQKVIENLSPNIVNSFVKSLRKTGNTRHDIKPKGIFYELLLKYPYQDNWERELKEKYIWYLDYVVNRFYDKDEEYSLIHFEHYLLPYIKEKVKADLDIDINDPTHYQIVAKRISGE